MGVNLSNLAPLILHGKQNLGSTTVRVFRSNLLVTSLNELYLNLAVLFKCVLVRSLAFETGGFLPESSSCKLLIVHVFICIWIVALV